MIPSGAYNPSIVRHNGRTLMSFRLHDRDDWRTNLYVAEIDSSYKMVGGFRVTMPEDIANHSHEDARLWVWNNRLMISWTISLWPATVFRAIVCYAKLEYGPTQCTISGRKQPQHGKNDFSSIEKNWSFIPFGDELYCIYQTNETVQTVLKLAEDGSVSDVLQTPVRSWAYGPVHGGAIVRYKNDKLVHFFNSRTGGDRRDRHRYHIGAAVLEATPPFRFLGISRRPILYGQEGACLDANPRYKPNVVFPCGAIEDGDGWLLSYGWNDCQCRLAVLGEKDLNL